jgi:Alginate export
MQGTWRPGGTAVAFSNVGPLDSCRRFLGALAIGVAGLTLAAPAASAQTIPLDPGPFPFLRYEQTCRTLADLAAHTTTPSEYIQLGDDPDYCLGIGGEVKERFEHYTNQFFGKIGIPQQSYLLSRVMLNADLHLGEYVRAFVQFGREDAVNKLLLAPVDRDRFDLAQGFLDLSSATEFADRVTLRVGRQEIVLGSARFVNARDGPNVRAAFDGFRTFATWENGSRLDLVLTRPTMNRPGSFDDGPDPHEIFGAAHYTMPLDAANRVNLDGYYYLVSTQNGEVESLHRPGQRNTVGMRLWGGVDPWDYDTDIVFQFGSQNQSEVRAGGVAAKVGYSFPTDGAWWRPRLVLYANYFSGTEKPSSGVINTFIPLYAGPADFIEPALETYENIIDFWPSLKLHPTNSIAVQFGPDFAWRASTHDAVYLTPGIPVPGTANVPGRYIGTNLILQTSWAATANLSFLVSLVHVAAGPAITNAHGKDTDYASVVTKVRF